MPSRFDKDMLRRSQSMITGKRGEVWPRKVAGDSNSANKSNQSNDSGVLGGGSVVRGVQKATFERDFPSLGAEETQGAPEVGRVSSPGLSSAIQSLPISTSAVIGGPGRTSALAEVPVIIASNTSTGVSSVQQTVPASSAPVSPRMMTGLNMAETLAQSPSRARTAPQSSVANQRLEELAIIQSRRLIPVTPSMPKASVLSPSEKPKPKIGQQQNQLPSSHLVNHTLRGGPTRLDVPKTSQMGKLHILKPVRERNGVSPTVKDSLSPTNGSKVVNSPLAVGPSGAGSAPLRGSSNNPDLASAERKPAAAPTTVERRPTSQAQSRNDFFNLMRKKSSTNPHSAVPDHGPAISQPILDKSNELITEVASTSVSPQGRDAPLLDSFGGDCLTENRDDNHDMTHNNNACDGSPTYCNKGEKNASTDAIVHPDEEEAAFLRSLGWEENAGDDEGLTEEEISSFCKEFMKLKPSSKLLQGMQPKIHLLLNSDMGSFGGASSELSSSDSKPE
ncbi:hypothetical protein L1049_015566 [Liquidambar formosana]|uniref:Uncharacterized protein n=1 Tax=Liquidambar formosana TaxID=63359 RepID=A0AAP0X6M4_LIQFO